MTNRRGSWLRGSVSTAVVALILGISGRPSHAQFPNDFKFGETTSFSMGMWVNYAAPQSTDVSLISNKNWNSGSNPGYIMTLDGSDWFVNARTSAGPRLDTTATALSTSAWHYVVMTMDRASGQVLAYTNAGAPSVERDGDAIGAGTFDTWSATPGLGLDLNIGQDGPGTYASGQSYKGLMDDVAIWNRVLSSDEISYLYNQGQAGSDLGTLFGTTAPGAGATINTGLVGYYDFEGNANDSSGRANNGAWKPGAGGAAAYASTLTGFGQGADFDGKAFVNIGDSPNPTAATWTGASAANNNASTAANWTAGPATWTAGTGLVIADGTTAFGSPPGAMSGPLLVQNGNNYTFGAADIGSTTQTTYIDMTGGTMTGAGSNNTVIGVASSSVALRLSGAATFNHPGDAEEAAELVIGQDSAVVSITMNGTSHLQAGYGIADATHATGVRRPVAGDPLPRTGDDIKLGNGGNVDLVMNQDSTIFATDVLYPNDAGGSGAVNVTQNDNSKVVANWDTRWMDTDGHSASKVVNWTMNDNSEFRVARDHGLGETPGEGVINLTISDNAKFTAGDRIVLGAGGGNVNVVMNGGLMKAGGNSPSDVLLVDETGGPSEPAVDWILHMGGGANAKLTVNGGTVEIGRSAFVGAGGGTATINMNGGTFRTLGVGPSAIGLGNGPGGGVADGVDWTTDVVGGEVVLARDAGDIGNFNYNGGTVEVARALIVGFGGDGKLTLQGKPTGGPAGSFAVHGELGFGGFSLNTANGTGTFAVRLNSGGMTPIVVDATNPNLHGDVTIFGGSKFELGMAAGYRPTIGANGSTQTVVQYAGSRLAGGGGSGQFTAADGRPEWGVDYSVQYNDGTKQIAVKLDYVYAAGDIDFNHQLTTADINAIVAANKFNQGPSAATWAQGDFDNNDQVDSKDIQMVLATNALNKGNYDVPPASNPPGAGVPALFYDPLNGNLTLATAGKDLNGFILTSNSNALTGAAATLPTSMFNVDTNGEISTAFVSIANAYNLGNVAATSLANAAGDLSLTYTVNGTAGIFGGANGAELSVVAQTAGDANLDGVVNIFDINAVSSQWNTSGTGVPSQYPDVNHDGTVNIFDINLISSNWAHVVPGGGSATAVPEPATWISALVACGIGCVLLRRRKGNLAG